MLILFLLFPKSNFSLSPATFAVPEKSSPFHCNNILIMVFIKSINDKKKASARRSRRRSPCGSFWVFSSLLLCRPNTRVTSGPSDLPRSHAIDPLLTLDKTEWVAAKRPVIHAVTTRCLLGASSVLAPLGVRARLSSPN